jgi:hypothetical protein
MGGFNLFWWAMSNKFLFKKNKQWIQEGHKSDLSNGLSNYRLMPLSSYEESIELQDLLEML